MIFDTKAIIEGHLRSGETIKWSDHPNRKRPGMLVEKFFTFFETLGKLSFLVAIYVSYAYLSVTEVLPEISQRLLIPQLRPDIGDIFYFLIGGITFYLLRYLITYTFEDESMEVYAITNDRILIVDENGVLSSYGPGEIMRPTIRTNRDGTGNIVFTERIQQLGALDSGDQREEKKWIGFYDLIEYKAAHKSLLDWLSEHKAPPEKIVNKALTVNFELKPYRDWTAQSQIVETAHLDNVLYSLLASEIYGDNRFAKEMLLTDKWNLLVLMKQASSGAGQDDARLSYFTIVVECAESFKSIGGVKRIKERENTYFNQILGDPSQLMRAIGKSAHICQLGSLFSKDAPPKIQINDRAKKNDMIKGMTGHELVGNINIMGNAFKYRQIYAYYAQSGLFEEPYILHLRFTFWCEEKLYKDNQNKIIDLVKSVKLEIPEPVEEKAEE